MMASKCVSCEVDAVNLITSRPPVKMLPDEVSNPGAAENGSADAFLIPQCRYLSSPPVRGPQISSLFSGEVCFGRERAADNPA